MSTGISKGVRAGLLASSLMLLEACAVGPNFRPPAPPSTDHYTPEPVPTVTASSDAPGGSVQHFVTDGEVPADWWRMFGPQPLDALVQRALKDSPTIAAAQATLRSASESYRGERSLLAPSVDATAGATRERDSSASFGLPFPSSLYNLYTTSVQVTYKLDLFGGNRRQIEAARAQADYQRYELEAARLTLADNVVTTAISIGSLKAQLAAIHDIVAGERDQLAVTERQLKAGTASHADVLSQQAQLAQTEATVPDLEKQLAQAYHRLAVLAGETPDHLELSDLELDAINLPTELPVSVPARLVRQRPDVQAAEAQLHQATAQVGVATANLLPSLSLTGSIGSDATATQSLLSAGTGVWNVGASLSQPIFHGGQLLAQRREAIANLEVAQANYRETVLTAMQQVADTLRALEADARDLKAQLEAEEAARASLAIARRQFAAGLNSHLAVLIAERQYLQARESRVLAQAARYSDSVALLQALGGGWWNRAPDDEKTASNR